MDSGACAGMDGKVTASRINSRLRCRGVSGKADSPEQLCVVILFHELDAVAVESLDGSDLRHHPCADLCATLVLHCDYRTNLQFTFQLDDCSVPVQVRCSGRHRERTFLTIISGKANRGAERHPVAAPLGNLYTIKAGCSDVAVMGFMAMVFRVFEAHRLKKIRRARPTLQSTSVIREWLPHK